MSDPVIRPATEADLAEMQAIYAHHVLHGTGTFEEVPPPVEEIAARHANVAGRGWPWLVAGDATGVLGYAYCAQFRDRSAYRQTAENAVYVREDVRGQGVGKALLAALVEAAGSCGFHQMLAVIGDADNTGSIGMHASLGFVQVGRLRGVGEKFGRTLDVVVMQRAVSPA